MFILIETLSLPQIMSKRILFYGIAFGSLLALTTFIYFENKLFNDFLQDTIISKIVPIIIQIIGVGLCIAAIKKAENGYITLGRAGFAGLMVSLVMGIMSSFFYFTYTKSKPNVLVEMKQSYLDRTMEFFNKPENKKQISEKDLKDKLKAYDYYMTSNQQMKLEMFKTMSVGLFIAGAFAFMLKRDPPNA